jgi:putative oxidoreductase
MPATPSTSLSPRAALILRVGLGLVFVAAGSSKLYALGPATMVIAERGIPFPMGVALGVGTAEALAGLLLVAGLRVRLVALLLIPMIVLAGLIFHSPLGLPPGAAHANAVSLTIDALVILGLAHLARRA